MDQKSYHVTRECTPLLSNMCTSIVMHSHTALLHQKCYVNFIIFIHTHCLKSYQNTLLEVQISAGKEIQLLHKLLGKAEYELTLWLGI